MPVFNVPLAAEILIFAAVASDGQRLGAEVARDYADKGGAAEGAGSA